MGKRIDLSERRLTPEQWQLVIDHHGLAVYMTQRATGISGNDIRNEAILEAAENGLIIAAEKWHVSMGCPFGTYAGGVIWRSTQRMKNTVKKKSMWNQLYEDESSIDPRNDIDNMELVDLVSHLMNKLPPEMQHILHLKFFEGRTYEEMSKSLGISIGMVKWGLKHALDKCRSIAEQKAFV